MFIIGLGCDGVGALLMAWPILRSWSAEKEVDRPRWNGDHWAPFRRAREQRLVSTGALFLVGGFLIQAAGYTVQLGWGDWWKGLGLLIPLVVLGLWAGVAFARRELPQHVWHESLQPFDRIADGLLMYGVRNARDLETVVTRHLASKGKRVEPIDDQGYGFVQAGLWQANCPRCHQATPATTPEWDTAICTTCGARFSTHSPPLIDAIVPSHTDIAAALRRSFTEWPSSG